MWPMLMNNNGSRKLSDVKVSDAQLLQEISDSAYSDPEAVHPAQVMYSEMESAQMDADNRNISSPKKGTMK